MLTTETLIAETDQLLSTLPVEKVRNVRDFAAFLVQQESLQALPSSETEEELRADMKAIMQHNSAFDFLHDEPDLYSSDDLIERYKEVGSDTD